MSTKKLKLYEKKVYGRILICVTDERDQVLITTLTGRKTLSLQDIDVLEQLGVIIEFTDEPKKKEA